MSKLAIGVTIDPSSIRPENAKFIYTYDPAQPSPPYLQNPQGDITLPGNKVAVEVGFRLLQENVRLANNQTYALSLPPKALEIAGPVPGKWPQQFDAPVQTGKPGKPPTEVVVIDRNDDTMTYKYSLGVVFTPLAGLAVTKVDDPKIRNGGDTRLIGPWVWPVLVIVLVLIALIAWRIATRGPDDAITDTNAPAAQPLATRPLDIIVTLKAKGSTPDKGLFFIFTPMDFASDTACYLINAAGDITIPSGDPDNIAINFHLASSKIQIGTQLHRVGFKLARTATDPDPHPFSVTPAPPRHFTLTKPVKPGSQGTYPTAVVTVEGSGASEQTFNYGLEVGLDVAGRIQNKGHDPKIRNGGNRVSPGTPDPTIPPVKCLD